VRRLTAILCLALLSLSLPGCSLFKKNKDSGSGGGTNSIADPTPAGSTPPPKFPTADTNPPKTDPLKGQSRIGSGNGMLAGRVLDGASRPPMGTSIFVVRADAKDDNAGKELSVSPDGYFTIENLDSGAQYKLVARGKNGDRAVAGIHYATAPNVLVLIQMKEDFVTSTTPGIQGPFGSLNDKPTPPLVAKETQTPPLTPTKEGWRPGVGVDVAGETTLPAVQVKPIDGFTQNGGMVVPPPLSIERPKSKPTEIAKIPPIDVPPMQAEQSTSLGSTKVPSCVLVGRQLINFALNDINGEPWELKKDRKGKLVLLDFWGTWCPPCRESMPTLKGLQSKYESQGLEVIGIAYERGGTPLEQGYLVSDLCKRLLVNNYRQLLGSGDHCVLKTQLGVNAFPTLILIDEQGQILWRHEGSLVRDNMGRSSRVTVEELERIIQSRARPVAGF
jgi:thiol-disulfide isomerase/thioredoxin